MWVEIVIAVLLSRLFIPVHELGHAVMAILTKYLFCSGFDGKLNLKITTTVDIANTENILSIYQPNGKTDTDLYEYFYENKDNSVIYKKIRRLIRINSVAGLLAEIGYGYLCYHILLQLNSSEYFIGIVLMAVFHVIRVLIILFMVVVIKHPTHDIRLIISPENITSSKTYRSEYTKCDKQTTEDTRDRKNKT